MANETHLAQLWQGVEAWNEWRRKHPQIQPDLSDAQLFRAYFSGANLSMANLSGVNLSMANLSGANLSKANLSKANLRGAYLSGANLNEANLNKANLTEASLSKIQALHTNFSEAILTGASIEDWNINATTQLAGITCHYVYLRDLKKERCPSSDNFAPGEFTKRFQKVVDTIELLFADGIEWQAFLTAFQNLLGEAQGNRVSIQAIENKLDGAFVIKINVPPEANKTEVERYLKREYEFHLKQLDEKYHSLFKAQDEKIAIYRQKSADLMEIIKQMATRPL